MSELNLNLHTKNCIENGCNCIEKSKENKYAFLLHKSMSYPGEYSFEYQYKTYTAIVNPCFESYNGTPHSAILNAALTKIKTHLGIEFEKCFSHFHTAKDSYVQYPSGYRNYDVKDDEVIEVLGEGGFNRNHFVIHKIIDLNLGGILNTANAKNIRWETYENIYHLSKRLPQTEHLKNKIEIFTKEMQKIK